MVLTNKPWDNNLALLDVDSLTSVSDEAKEEDSNLTTPAAVSTDIDAALLSSLQDWTILDCLCPNCKGNTAVKTTSPINVPEFREIFLMTVECAECSFHDSEVIFEGGVPEYGERITLHVSNADDLNRRVFVSKNAMFYFPQMELALPKVIKGTMSTLQGVLRKIVKKLEVTRPYKSTYFIDQMKLCANGGMVEKDGNDDEEHVDNDNKTLPPFSEFDIVLLDPSGYSYIENLMAPHADPAMTHIKFHRSTEYLPNMRANAAVTIDDIQWTTKSSS